MNLLIALSTLQVRSNAFRNPYRSGPPPSPPVYNYRSQFSSSQTTPYRPMRHMGNTGRNRFSPMHHISSNHASEPYGNSHPYHGGSHQPPPPSHYPPQPPPHHQPPPHQPPHHHQPPPSLQDYQQFPSESQSLENVYVLFVYNLNPEVNGIVFFRSWFMALIN